MNNYVNNFAKANASRKESAARKLDHAEHMIQDGYLPEVASHAAGFGSLQTARRAAGRQARTELAATLRYPTQQELERNRHEDLEFCLDTGEWPTRAIARAGYTGTLLQVQKRLYKRGRRDLAARLAPPPPITEDDPI